MATILSLFLSTLLMIGIVAVSSVEPAAQIPEPGLVDPGTLSLRDPFGGGVLAWEVFAAPEHAEAGAELDLARFATLVLGLGLIGWIMEAVLTGLIVRYVARVRPDLVKGNRG
jgi:hypothetical protein